MATYTTIPTFTAGQVLTSSVMNDVKNNLDLGNAQSAYPYRNLLYNGAMQISQRAAVGSGQTGKTASGYYTADRWNISLTSGGTWTQSVEADAPAASGFVNSLKMACTTATGALSTTNVATVEQRLEGYDVQRILKGTASAKALTLTFWVKSNVTGSYVVELQDADNTRFCSASYTISASGTWEQKSVTFPADTTGVFTNDSNESLRLNFWLLAGTNYTSGTLGTTWHTTTANRLGGPTTYANVGSANTNTWQLTGVQLETGSVSTPFEFLQFGDELQRCQRYYEKSYDYGTAVGTASVEGWATFTVLPASTTESNGGARFSVEKRATPGTLSVWAYDGTSGSATNAGVGNVVVSTTTFTSKQFNRITHAGQTANQQLRLHWAASAEL